VPHGIADRGPAVRRGSSLTLDAPWKQHPAPPTATCLSEAPDILASTPVHRRVLTGCPSSRPGATELCADIILPPQGSGGSTQFFDRSQLR
jgi:hypothetical protein